jgi:hypothetical protein
LREAVPTRYTRAGGVGFPEASTKSSARSVAQERGALRAQGLGFDS